MNVGSISTARPAVVPGTAILRKVFSFPVAMAGLLPVLAVLTTRSRFDDPDMWWHLRTGQVIWTTHSIPTTDLFSFTASHHALVPQEWLSQVLIYFAYWLGGYSGLMLWLVVFTSAILVAGYALCSFYSGNSKVGFAGALTIWFFATAGMAVRPQMVGYLLLVIELLVLHAGRTRNPAWFFVLPPLFALWINCHGSFFLGLVVVCAVLFCSLFHFRAGLLVAPQWVARRRAMLAIALALSVAALWINPVGTRQVLYPLDTMFRQQLNLSIVTEWAPLQLSSGRGIGFLLVLGGVSLIVMLRRAELFWDEVVLLAIATWLASEHSRLVFVFGILAAPTLSRLLAGAWDRYDAERDRPLLNAGFLAAALAIAWAAFPGNASLQNQVEQRSPVRAVQYIRAHHVTGNMLNEYVFGGYLVWAAPNHPVFVDGRADLYEWAGVLKKLAQWEQLESDPRDLLREYNIQFCLLARQSPMVRVVSLLPGWEQVYSDDVSTILVRTGHPGTLEASVGDPAAR